MNYGTWMGKAKWAAAAAWRGVTLRPAPEAGDQTDRDMRLIHESGIFDADWYAQHYADIGGSGAAPLVHFYFNGAREGRKPCFLFDTQWYLTKYPDVAKSGMHPLVHYIRFGENEGRQPSLLFDPNYYAGQFARRQKPESLLGHYMTEGHMTHRPNAYFDTEFYLACNEDIVSGGVSPFHHYLVQGWREDREINSKYCFPQYRREIEAKGIYEINPLAYYLTTGEVNGDVLPPGRGALPPVFTHANQGVDLQLELQRQEGPGSDFESELIGNPLLASGARARLFAFYLPQFYPFAENDEWWGKGFTEWRNVTRALPRFHGHQQPRLPRDLGFYDLRNVETLREQVALARASAVAGFCFYYYWFNGKRLLDRPLDAFLSSDIDFPFCLMWANENWTRRWDGMEQDVLMRQDYLDDDDAALVDDLAAYFRDERYERVDGRPLFFIYRPGVIPDFADKLDRWRELFAERHGMNPLFMMAQGFGDTDPRPFGLDGAIEFPPHKLATGLVPVNARLRLTDTSFSGHYMSYDDLVSSSLEEPVPPFELIRTAVPSWDNEPRKPGRGMGFVGATPEKYGAWLRELSAQASERPLLGRTPYVFVNAWNEWAEGAFLEPDLHFGSAYLNATFRAMTGLRKQPRGVRSLLLVGHDAYLHGAQLLLLNIMRTLRLEMGVNVSLLLLEGGPLLPEYRKLGDVVVVAERGQPLGDVVVELAARFPDKMAICNTVVTGEVVESLSQHGFQTVSLVHELSNLISERGLEGCAKSIARRADRIVFAADFVKESFEHICGSLGSKAVVRPQGIYQPVALDPSQAGAIHRKLDLPAEAQIVINLGYGDLRKGFDLFLEVAKKVCREERNAHFVWLGNVDPQLLHWLSVDVQGGLGGRFHVLPFDTDVGPYLNSASVLALTSREDPFPSVVMEALACGVPVVAFEGGGGYVEAVRRRTANGEVVPMADTDAMATAIQTVLHTDTAEVALERSTAALSTYRWRDYVFSLLQDLMPALRKVSVVVPNYNYANHLPARLSSIFEQEYPIYELIVLDDASQDESLDVLAKLEGAASRRLRVIANETNSGSVFKQWEKGAISAGGDYLWIAEADDLASGRLLADLMASMDADTALAFCDSRQIDQDGALLGNSYRFYYEDLTVNPFTRSFSMPGRDFVSDVLSTKNVILNVSSVVFDRTRLLQVLDRSSEEIVEYRVAGDWRLYAELLLEEGVTVAYVDRPHNVHRRHAASVTHALKADRHLAEIEAVQRYIAQHGISRDAHEAARGYLESVTRQLRPETVSNDGAGRPEQI